MQLFKMYKLLGILFISFLVATEGRLELPMHLNSSVTNAIVQREEIHKLPDHTKPLHYDIHLIPNFSTIDQERFAFDGIVTIQLIVLKETNEIVLHAENLTVNEVKLTDFNTKIPLKTKTEVHGDFRFIIREDGVLKPDQYSLEIRYKGLSVNDMQGLYRSSYKNSINETVWLVMTHFEPVGARRVFPCFDEPTFKATFALAIYHTPMYNVISNTKVKTVTPHDPYNITLFETTPIMSTYSLGFVVSDLKNTSTSFKNFTILAKQDVINKGLCDFALEKGFKLLKMLENVTGINFELETMDQAAIPDFADDTTENWGLVTYREKSLLLDDSISTTSEKQAIVETIAYKFAQQWFGGLVSPKWWNFLWLNKGFANFFQSYIIQLVDPIWESVNHAVVKSIQTTIFDFDSGTTTQPINQDVVSPAKISAIFNSISYQKGGALIRMIQHFLTNEVFMEGVNTYLKNNSFNVVDSDTLFGALQESADKNKIKVKVKEVMDSWINRKGYPVVTVTRNYKEKSFAVTQERFFSYNSSKKDNNDSTLWHIPINFAVLDLTDAKAVPYNMTKFDNTRTTHWLATKTRIITADFEAKQVLILNKQQTGFYRVNYDDQNWDLIIQYLKSENRSKIHELNRAQLVNDALAFAKQGSMNFTRLLNLTEYLKDETNYIAWYPGYKTFSWVKSKLMNTIYYQSFKERVFNITKNLIKTVGFEEIKEENPLTRLNRIAVLNLSCSLGHKECNSNMLKKVESWLNKDNSSISVNLRQITFCNGLRSADLKLWQSVFNKTIKSTEPERSLLMMALSCSEKSNNLNYYLNETIKSTAQLGNIEVVINNILDNSDAGIDVLLTFLTKNYFKIYKIINFDDTRMTMFFTSLAKKFTTPEQFHKLKSQCTNMNIPEEWTKEALGIALNRIEWFQKNIFSIEAWLKENEEEKNGVGSTSASITLISLLSAVIFMTWK